MDCFRTFKQFKFQILDDSDKEAEFTQYVLIYSKVL